MVGLDFVVLGLAQCFSRDEDGQLLPVLLIEPVPSAAFLALLQDIPSSFSMVVSVDPTHMLQNDTMVKPNVFPSEAQFPHDFLERLSAASRTFQYKPEAREALPLGKVLTLDKLPNDKRIINQTNVVKDEDNVKQHPLSHQSF